MFSWSCFKNDDPHPRKPSSDRKTKRSLDYRYKFKQKVLNRAKSELGSPSAFSIKTVFFFSFSSARGLERRRNCSGIYGVNVSKTRRSGVAPAPWKQLSKR